MRPLLRSILVAILCLCGCDNPSSETAPPAIGKTVSPAIEKIASPVIEKTASPAIEKTASPAFKKSSCEVGTICKIGRDRYEAVIYDEDRGDKDSPGFRGRVEAIAQMQCGIERKHMDVLDVDLEEGPGAWVMRLQFKCTGPTPTAAASVQRHARADRARRVEEGRYDQNAGQLASELARIRLIAQRAGDPVHQEKLALRAIEDAKRYRFVVSFYSACCGPDPDAGASFDAILAEQERAFGRSFKYTDSAWGLEGESSRCFPLDELDAQEQRKFVRAFTSRLRANLTSITQNAQCPSRHWD